MPRAYACFTTSVLPLISRLPFTGKHTLSELGQFTCAMRDAIKRLRDGCGDAQPNLWTRGRDHCIERQTTLRFVTQHPPKQTKCETLCRRYFGTGDVYYSRRKGHRTGRFLPHNVGVVSWVMQCHTRCGSATLQGLVVSQVVGFSDYLSELRSMIASVHNVGEVAPDETTIQLLEQLSLVLASTRVGVRGCLAVKTLQPDFLIV